MSEVLSRESNLPEILWNFSRLEGLGRLTLKQNPHFYKFPDFPKTRKKYHGEFKVDPIEDFRDAIELDARIWVITDKPGRIFIKTPHHMRAFGNVWHVPDNDAIIFKGSSMTLPFLPSFLTNSLLDICGNIEGEDVVHVSIRSPSELRYLERLPSPSTSPSSEVSPSPSSPYYIATPSTTSSASEAPFLD